jgi:hypothetical protein
MSSGSANVGPLVDVRWDEEPGANSWTAQNLAESDHRQAELRASVAATHAYGDLRTQTLAEANRVKKGGIAIGVALLLLSAVWISGAFMMSRQPSVTAKALLGVGLGLTVATAVLGLVWYCRRMQEVDQMAGRALEANAHSEAVWAQSSWGREAAARA